MELLDKLFIRLPDGDRCDDRLDPEFDPALAAFIGLLQSGGGRLLIPRRAMGENSDRLLSFVQ